MNSSWEYKHLGTVVDILDRQRVPVSAKERAARPGTVPYYGATGQVGTIDAALFDEPLVLLGEDGVQFFDLSKPKAYPIDGPAWVNNHAHVLRVREDIDRRFLTYYLNYFSYRGYANGTTRLKLTQAAMKTIPIPTPLLDEQRRIVDSITELFERLSLAKHYQITALRKSNSMILKSLSEEVMRALKTCTPRPLGQHAIVIQYGTSAKTAAEKSDASVPVIRMGNIQGGQLQLDSLKFLPRDHPDFPKLLLNDGDLLFNRTNSPELVGKSAVFRGGTDTSYASYLIRVQFDENVLPEWANLVINSPYGRLYIKSVTTQQVGQANVNGKKLQAFPLPVPPLEEQRAAVERHERVIRGTSLLSQQMTTLQRRTDALRHSILAAAFEGRLTTKPDRSAPHTKERVEVFA